MTLPRNSVRQFAACSLAGLAAVLVWSTGTDAAAPQARAGAPAAPAQAGPPTPEPWPDAKAMEARKKDAQERALFQSYDQFEMTLTSDFKAIDRDRDPTSTVTFPGTVEFPDGKGGTVKKPVLLRGRGHSRRNPKICDFSPIRLEFKKEDMAGTLFAGPNNLKLGTHCRSNAVFEQYVLREYTAYKIFNLLTPDSFRARLVRVNYFDTATNKSLGNYQGLLLEDDGDVAKRMMGRITEQKGLLWRHVDRDYTAMVVVFEYLLGNTDVSIYSQHNVRVVETPANKRYPVPYDFDYSGLVNATYAMFDKAIFNIQSVRDRVFRGQCRPLEEYAPTFDKFRAVKNDVLALYDNQPAFTAASRQEAKSYIEKFYKTLDTPGDAKKAFVDTCVKEGSM